jgi:NAD(P)-dependent dehydrogenase (short-subunit alcohol dehydrogenase family)
MNRSTRLAGKRALVTGASSGLGAHFATVLAAHGAEVVLAARRLDTLEAAAERIRDYGKVRAISVDVTQQTSVNNLAKEAGPIDIVVNSAGIVREGSALDQSEQNWNDVIDTNLKGMFFVAQAIAHAMHTNGGGSIINIASILGLRQTGGVLPYAVSKAGVIQMTKLLALEWARHGIRVNAIAPGYFVTELNNEFWHSPAGEELVKRIPQRRLGQFPDLDGPLLLLASDDSRYMTGSILVVDGGHLVSSL